MISFLVAIVFGLSPKFGALVASIVLTAAMVACHLAGGAVAWWRGRR